MKITLLFIAMLLGGCCTWKLLKHAEVPSGRIYYAQPAITDSAKVIFRLEEGLQRNRGKSHYQHIYMDGKRIASLQRGEYLELRVSPTYHCFGVKPTDPYREFRLYSVRVELDSQDEISYCIVPGDKGSKIERVDATLELFGLYDTTKPDC